MPATIWWTCFECARRRQAVSTPAHSLVGTAAVEMRSSTGSRGNCLEQVTCARALLQLTRPSSTFAERSSQVGCRQAKDEVSTGLAGPVAPGQGDTAPELSRQSKSRLPSLIRMKQGSGFSFRSARKSLPGSLLSEIQCLRRVPATAVPLLEQVSESSRSDGEMALVTSCLQIADPRLVPLLVDRLDPGSRRFDGRPWKPSGRSIRSRPQQHYLRGEANLMAQTENCRVSGATWHGGWDAFAVEHMSERSLREQAVAALAAIRSPQAAEDLRKILRAATTPPGRRQ